MATVSTHTFTTEYEGVELDIDYTYCPACRGARGSYGEPLEPDEPASIVVDSVRTKHGDELFDLMSEKALLDIEREAGDNYAGR